jgi:hypothetical protein
MGLEIEKGSLVTLEYEPGSFRKAKVENIWKHEWEPAGKFELSNYPHYFNLENGVCLRRVHGFQPKVTAYDEKLIAQTKADNKRVRLIRSILGWEWEDIKPLSLESLEQIVALQKAAK